MPVPQIAVLSRRLMSRRLMKGVSVPQIAQIAEEVQARLNSEAALAAEQQGQLQVQVDCSKAIFFDSNTGARVGKPE